MIQFIFGEFSKGRKKEFFLFVGFGIILVYFIMVLFEEIVNYFLCIYCVYFLDIWRDCKVLELRVSFCSLKNEIVCREIYSDFQ